ncbi:hypothetical protein [Streptomyces sp. NPDC052036]|uniref:hypothetical protein n=1 Tax=unclassified Streptomyces TaxID=2593676 RepID=UPI003439F03F
MTTQNAIEWPERYLPGTGDNFVSNEVIVRGLGATEVWPHLVDTSRGESYYDNVAGISFPDGDGPELKDGVRFRRPAAEPATRAPGPMLNGHQAWLDGLVRAAAGKVGG